MSKIISDSSVQKKGVSSKINSILAAIVLYKAVGGVDLNKVNDVIEL